MSFEKWESGDCILYRGDCLEVLPTLGKVDAVVTDPPYGIDWRGHGESTQEWAPIVGDAAEFDLRNILRMECLVIAFGANCYPAQLPHRGRWICWDKRVVENADRMHGSAFEMAWTNRTSGFDRMYRIMHGGVVNADGPHQRVHPTQKPIELMRRIIEDFTDEGATVLDPFMGSGTTGVACVKLGRRFIGIEIDEGYFNIAKRRILKAQNDAPLFNPKFRQSTIEAPNV